MLQILTALAILAITLGPIWYFTSREPIVEDTILDAIEDCGCVWEADEQISHCLKHRNYPIPA
jgi:hypothetical protein